MISQGFTLFFQLLTGFINNLGTWHITGNLTFYQLLLGFIVVMIMLNFFRILVNHGSLTGGDNHDVNGD